MLEHVPSQLSRLLPSFGSPRESPHLNIYSQQIPILSLPCAFEERQTQAALSILNSN